MNFFKKIKDIEVRTRAKPVHIKKKDDNAQRGVEHGRKVESDSRCKSAAVLQHVKDYIRRGCKKTAFFAAPRKVRKVVKIFLQEEATGWEPLAGRDKNSTRMTALKTAI